MAATNAGVEKCHLNHLTRSDMTLLGKSMNKPIQQLTLKEALAKDLQVPTSCPKEHKELLVQTVIFNLESRGISVDTPGTDLSDSDVATIGQVVGSALIALGLA